MAVDKTENFIARRVEHRQHDAGNGTEHESPPSSAARCGVLLRGSRGTEGAATARTPSPAGRIARAAETAE